MARNCRSRWYQPTSGGNGSAVLYLHGGGMIVGSVPIFDGPVARYVTGSGVAMLSIQDRLAPEHPHPPPVDDAYAGLVWLAEHAEELGVDPERLASSDRGSDRAATDLHRSRAADNFRDEDVRYALTLSQAGVPVELHLHPSVPHEYDAIAFNSDVAVRAQADRERILRSL